MAIEQDNRQKPLQTDTLQNTQENAIEQRVHAWIDQAGLEMSPTSKKFEKFDLLQSLNRYVAVTNSPDRPFRETVQFAINLAANNIPTRVHIAARGLQSETELFDSVDTLFNNKIQDLLVIGGDWEKPAGPYTSAIDALRALSSRDYKFNSIGIALYPGGHNIISDADLDKALKEKQNFADQSGIPLFGITQLHLNASETLDWIQRKRDEGIRLPIHIGVAGPMSIPTLGNFILRCGVKDAAKMIASAPATSFNLALESIKGYTPNSMLRELAVSEEISGITVFTLNALDRTAQWLNK